MGAKPALDRIEKLARPDRPHLEAAATRPRGKSRHLRANPSFGDKAQRVPRRRKTRATSPFANTASTNITISTAYICGVRNWA